MKSVPALFLSETRESELKKILVVDDEAFLRELVRATFSGTTYQILEAADGKEALEAVSQHIPDLILLDIMMPCQSGFEVCRTIKKNERTRHAVVMLMTGCCEGYMREEGLRAGADDCLPKPFRPLDLIERVQAFLH
jgi:CheY-like chemotaxis protein